LPVRRGSSISVSGLTSARARLQFDGFRNSPTISLGALMHPELLHALAQERQAELLRQHQFRHRWKQSSAPFPYGSTRPLHRVRLSMGTVLVAAGTRLLGGASAKVDIVSSRR
jgi:hypothetical protein